MRMLMDVQFPVEPFNTLVKNGTASQIIQKVLEAVKPEAAYFAARGEGKRSGMLVVDVPDASKIPSLAEPFFLHFNASVMLYPCMTPADLANAGLDEIGKKYR